MTKTEEQRLLPFEEELKSHQYQTEIKYHFSSETFFNQNNNFTQDETNENFVCQVPRLHIH